MYSRHEELEAVAVLSEAEAALHEGADLEGLVAGGVVEGISVIANDCLAGGESGYEEQEGEGPHGHGSDALLSVGQTNVSDYCSQKEGRR
jgi:hypothetical protein